MVTTGDRTAEQVAEARQVLKAFARADYKLFPLKRGTKIPRDEGWQTKPYSLAGDIAAWVKGGGNIGVRLRDIDLVLDVDPRNFAPGDDPLRRLHQDVGVDVEDAPTVVTGRGDGGRHIYWRKPAGMRVVGKLEGYEGIDFRSAGMFVVAPGSVHPDTGGLYYMQEEPLPLISDVREAPDALLALIAREDNPIRIGGEGAGVMTNEQMAAMLAVLDPADYGRGRYDKWIALAAACHDATGGGGLIEFLAWCAGDPDYADEARRSAWLGTGRPSRPASAAARPIAPFCALSPTPGMLGWSPRSTWTTRPSARPKSGPTTFPTMISEMSDERARAVARSVRRPVQHGGERTAEAGGEGERPAHGQAEGR